MGRGQAFQANPSKGYFGQMWPKPEKQRDFLSSAHGKRATNSKNSCKTRVLSAFWPPKKRSKVKICQKWPPFCRFFVEMASRLQNGGFQTAKHYKNRGLGTTTWPMTKKGWIFGFKNGLKTRERSIFSKIEASKRGF